jgi:hypothetical protein
MAADKVAPAVVTGSVASTDGVQSPAPTAWAKAEAKWVQEMAPTPSYLLVLCRAGLVTPSAVTESTGYALNSGDKKFPILVLQYFLRLLGLGVD